MRFSQLPLVLVCFAVALSACDVKKSPESAAVTAPDSPRPPELSPAPSAAAPAASEHPTPASERPTAASERPTAATAPTPGPNDSSACEARKDALKSRFVEAARCQTDAECEAFQPGCPFGCGLALHRATDVSLLKRDIAAFKRECNDCTYRCRPPAGPPICRAGTCAFSARAAK
jgi:hypothetical protein